jgi:glycosyltransferase involved in cell wall biosynthesis
MISRKHKSTSNIKPVLSIILPTRNAGDYIYWTIKSILLSDDTRFELIVVNNNFPKFQNFAEYSTDSRFKDLKASKRLSMSENWQLGLEKSKGEWIMYIGSDDGVVSKNLTLAIDLLVANSEKWDVLQFRSLAFVYSMEGRNPWVEIPKSPTTTTEKRVFSPKSLVALFPSQLSSLLPIPYGNSICKRAALQSLQHISGGIPGIAPDFFLGFFLAEKFSSFLSVDICLPIRGLSDNSNGYQYLNQIRTQNSEEFIADVNERRKQSLTPEMLRCRTTIAVEDRFLAAKYARASTSFFHLHFIRLIRFATCMDSSHHKSVVHKVTLRIRTFLFLKVGYLLRKIWLLSFGVKTSNLRNYKLILGADENIFTVQSRL